MTNTSGSVVWKTDYKPFGEEQSITGTIENNEKFAGKVRKRKMGSDLLIDIWRLAMHKRNQNNFSL